MNIRIRTIAPDLHEVEIEVDGTTIRDTNYDIHLKELREKLVGAIEDIDSALEK